MRLKNSAAMILVVLLVAAARVNAQSNPIYVSLSPAKGALYRPDTGQVSHTAVLLGHRSANFMSHIAARELSRRGFLVLAMNPRFENNEPNVIFEDIALDVRAGVTYLRRQPGITKVVLLGHSGGGATMTFYQAVAEKGPSAARGPRRLVQGDSTRLAALPRADGLILVDAHPGGPVNILRSLDPRVRNEADPFKLDPTLDPLDPRNGYKPSGPTRYSAEFKKRYHEAQSARMNRLIERAQDIVRRMEAGTYRYRDNDLFLVTQTASGGLRRDLTVNDVTHQPRRLLKDDGTIVTQIIERSPALASDAEPQNTGGQLSFSNTRIMTVRSFLSTFAVRSTNAIDGIDWTSSNNSVPNNVRSITVPLLVTAMGAYSFIRDNEVIFENAASTDKEYIVSEGATHDMVPADRERYPNMTRNFFDYLTNWMNARF